MQGDNGKEKNNNNTFILYKYHFFITLYILVSIHWGKKIHLL